MEITITQKQARVPVTVIHLKGDFDSYSAGNFDEEVLNAVQSGTMDLLLDLSKVPFMSSAGIRSLTTLYNLLNPVKSDEEKHEISQGLRTGTYKAPHLKLLNPSDRVLQVMKMSGLDMYLDIFTKENKALAAF